MSTFFHYLAPIAVGAVAIVLLLGLVNMVRGGSSNRSQNLMRWRVILQFVAIVAMMTALYFGVALMVVLNKIYTRTGDDGTSALATGERRSKADLRFEAIGTIDEVNACVGLARLHQDALGGSVGAMLGRIQNDLFDLGADLATPERPDKRERLRITAAQVERLEREIDTINAGLAPLTSFVLPGGTPAAAALHLARTVARRAERLMVELSNRETVNGEALHYVNRLSDFLFVAARFANEGGQRDVLWVPGQNR